MWKALHGNSVPLYPCPRCGAADSRWLSPSLLLDDHRVTDINRVEIPLGVGGAQADAAVADVFTSKRLDGPRSRMHEQSAAAEPGGVLHWRLVTRGIGDRNADTARIHNHSALFGHHRINTDRCRELRSTHRGGHDARFAPMRLVVWGRQLRRRSARDPVDAH